MRLKTHEIHSRYACFLAAMFLVYVLVFQGCDNSPDSPSTQGGTCSVSFHVIWERPADSGPSMNRAITAPCGEVDHLVATVYNQDREVLKEGGPWSCSEGQGTLSDVPAGTRGWIEVYLINAEGGIVYKGISMEINLIPGQTIDAGEIEANSFIPGLSTPAENAVVINGNVTFAWEALASAARYELQVTNNVSGEQFLYETSGVSYQTHDLIAQLTSYRWRIRAIGTEGDEGAWSNERSFTTEYNYIPTATISSPSANDRLFGNIWFSGYGMDMDEMTSFDYSPRWTSSIDGVIGTEDSFYKGDLSLGTHIITLTVTDSVGAVDSASISIIVAREWTATFTPIPNPSGGNCASGSFSTSCTITYDPGTYIYSMTFGNGWGCPPGESCSLQGTETEGTYTLVNDFVYNSQSYHFSTSFSDNGPSYSGSGSPYSISCNQGFTFSLTNN